MLLQDRKVIVKSFKTFVKKIAMVSQFDMVKSITFFSIIYSEITSFLYLGRAWSLRTFGNV